MKTFIVYNLDTQLPVAVGEALKAEWARIETAAKTNIRAENLIAEEVTLLVSWSVRKRISGQGKWLGTHEMSKLAVAAGEVVVCSLEKKFLFCTQRSCQNARINAKTDAC